VKGSIILPLVQILLILIISTLLCAGTFLFIYNNNYGPEANIGIGIFISHLPHLLLNIFPIVVLISVVLSLVNTLKTPANKGFAALFTLITASIIYYGGYTGLTILDKYSKPIPIVPGNHLYEGRINPLSESKVYIKTNNNKLMVIEESEKSRQSSFKSSSDAEYIVKSKTLILDNNYTIDIKPDNPFFSEILSPPKLFKNLLKDLDIFNRSIKDIFDKSNYLFMITVISQIAFAIGCWTLIKLSKWPFLNGLLAIAVIRFFPAYYRFSYSDLTQKAIGFLKTSYASDLAPVVILLFIALLLFLWDILFIKSRNAVGNK
jgi:hypothetical protein